MGRSGSSYLAGILHASGIDMGSELKPADQFNERGYYEDLPVTRLHEGWLARLGLAFDSVSDEFPIEGTPEMDQELQAALGPRLENERRWGIKPPGILFFWPIWQRVVPETACLLVPFRHPEGVAESYVAGGDKRERALALWTSLNRLALEVVDSSGFLSLFLDFDDPRSFAPRLRPLLGSVTDPYEPGIHHHRARPLLSGEAAGLYEELKRRAQHP
jgi:hypothetical protein